VTLAIHYMKPEWFRDGIMGAKPDPANLAATHVFLTTFEAQEGQPIDHALEDVFLHFQAEVWSPNGEARALIERKGLGHTSMSVGDVAVVDGKAFVVASFGFEPLKAAGAWGVFCTVCGGVTGSRSGWLKDDKGRAKSFPDKASAEAEAERLMKEMNGPHATASFYYRAAQREAGL
jgi:hypothetical protein